jgi:hypothetical protein
MLGSYVNRVRISGLIGWRNNGEGQDEKFGDFNRIE